MINTILKAIEAHKIIFGVPPRRFEFDDTLEFDILEALEAVSRTHELRTYAGYATLFGVPVWWVSITGAAWMVRADGYGTPLMLPLTTNRKE